MTGTATRSGMNSASNGTPSSASPKPSVERTNVAKKITASTGISP